ncbi:MAG: T9SS C-terminal target domain-containing protein [Bacteroidales bacterium]|nr:MAG: T9SS C-terminal target domain-containing protein [Bacteroidales bacterium]
MKKILLTCIIAMLLFSAKAQQTDWQYLGQQKKTASDFELVKSDPSEIVVKFTQTAYGLQSITTAKGKAYVIIPFKGSQIEKKGAPDLGKNTQSVIIPDTEGMMIEVVSSKFTDVENIDIAPSKGVISRDKNPKDIPYEYGIEYKTDAFFPKDIAYLGEPYIIRDFRGQTIVMQPYQYNPVTKKLRIFSEITVKVTSTGKEGKNPLMRQKAIEQVDSRFESIYSNQFLNYTQSKYTPISENGGKMLIICYDNFASTMQPLVTWKNSIGIQTELVNYSTINSSAALKTYVQNYYNTKGLTFLLIVGDNAQVPTSSTSAGDSDNNYGYIVGSDHYLDIFVGRFSAENATQVTTQVNRTLYYERDMPSSAANIIKGVGIASNEGAGGGGDNGESDEQHMNNIKTDLTGYGYTITNCYQNGGTTAQLSSLINTGTGIINYVGHGSNTSWAAPSFSNTNVDALTNTNKYPFIFSVACVVGNFKSITCFAEAWLRSTDDSGNPAGAIVFCGSTINQSWASPMLAQDEMNDLLVANSYKSYGGIFVNGLFKMIDGYGTDGANMADTWTVFGDPSLLTRTPGHLNGPNANTDTQAPTAPANLAASNIAQTTLTLAWTASTDNIGVTGYNIYKNGTLLTTVTGTTYNVTGLTANTSYSFYVKAKDAAGNISAASNTINVTTLVSTDTQAPTAPTNLAASSIAQTTLTLSWTASTDNVGVTGYDVYRGGTTLVGSTATTSLNVTGLTANTSYSFTVKAKDAAGNISSASVALNVTTINGAYCTSQGNTITDEWIASVKVGSFTKTSGASNYSDFTSTTITMALGSNSVTLTPGFSSSAYTEYWAVWIDFNNNQSFTDAGELVFSGNGQSAVSGSITIPTSASGSTRMRISMKYNAAPTSCEVFSYGEVEDYTVSFGGVIDTQAPSVPTGLTASNIAQTSCTLSWTASTDNVGVTGYDVYRGTTLAGSSSTTSLNVTGLTANTLYSFTVKAKDAAGNVSAASSALNVTTLPNVITYCSSAGTNFNYEWISKVVIGTLTNTSAASGYTDFTSKTITATAGSTQSVALTPGFSSTSYSEYWKIWIDFNGDGDFADAGEEVFSKNGTSAVTGTIAIPSTASGTTRLRVVMQYNAAPLACGSYTYGETEDYKIQINRERATDDIITETSISCFPNPTDDDLKLRITSEYSGSTQILVINTIGQVIQNFSFSKLNRTEETSISLSDLPSGIYIISVRMNGKVLNERVVLK